jgi:hypothetical protein
VNGPKIDGLIARYRRAITDVDLARQRYEDTADEGRRRDLRRCLDNATADALTEARALLDVFLAERET